LSIQEDLDLLERIFRRHVPDCFAVEAFELTTVPPGNPAPFCVRARIRRISASPAPPGWVADAIEEIRIGWDGDEFLLSVEEEASEFDDGHLDWPTE